MTKSSADKPAKKAVASKTETAVEPEAPKKRAAPAVLVPPPLRPGQQHGGVRQLQTMLRDLGHYKGRIHGRYDNELRNATSMLQQRLAADGFYDGVPHGRFDAATRAALLASDIPTTE